MEGKTKRQRKRANGGTQENERGRRRMVERQMSELKEAIDKYRWKGGESKAR